MMISLLRSFPSSLTGRGRQIPARDRLLDAFRASTREARQGSDPMATRYLPAPSGAVVELKFAFNHQGFKVPSKDVIIIERLVARAPGQGDGTFAMKRLTDLADAHGIHLTMFMKPISHRALPMDKLVGWSGQHGFKEYNLPQGLFWREPVRSGKTLTP